MRSSAITKSNQQFLKKKLEKLNLMLITAKKLEDRIDEARSVLTHENRIFSNQIPYIQFFNNYKH